MQIEEDKPNNNNDNSSTCPPIEVGLHQNSYNPKKNVEERK